MSKTRSDTWKDKSLAEFFVGGHHYVTRITDGSTSVMGLGNTQKQSQKIASEKWSNTKKGK